MGNIKFDLYEAIILLNIYLIAKKKKIKTINTATIASMLLRTYALRRGMSVDSNYRSPAGLQGRLRIMQGMYESIGTSNPKSVLVFSEAIELYRNKPEKFVDLQKEILIALPEFSDWLIDIPIETQALPSASEEVTDDMSVKDYTISQIETAVLQEELVGITADALAFQLCTTVSAVKKAIDSSMNIISICERLIHKESFVDWEEGAQQLDEILKKLMEKNNGYVSAIQLYNYARVELEMFLNDNDMNDERKVFDIAEHLFAKENYHDRHYIFRNKAHISRMEEMVSSKLDIMRKYARDEGGFFNEEDLERYLQRLDIKTASLRQQMKVYDEPIFLFYEPGVLITSESIGIDEHWLLEIKGALNKLFEDAGDHLIIRDIQPWWYTLLPRLPQERPWTALLLQSILRHYSKVVGARTIYGLINQSADTLHAMIVSLNSDVQTFADAVISVLLEQHIEQRYYEAEELRQMLIQRGMIAGNELIWNMPKALPNDTRFIWDNDGRYVTIKI